MHLMQTAVRGMAAQTWRSWSGLEGEVCQRPAAAPPECDAAAGPCTPLLLPSAPPNGLLAAPALSPHPARHMQMSSIGIAEHPGRLGACLAPPVESHTDDGGSMEQESCLLRRTHLHWCLLLAFMLP